MKKTITLALAALVATAAVASAASSKLADMDTLVASGTLGTGVTKDTTQTGTVYTFTGEGAITGITNQAIVDLIGTSAAKGDTLLTVAAWVKPTTDTTTGAIFGFGGESDGFSFALSDGVAQFNGTNSITAGTALAANTWTLVALSIPLNQQTLGRFFFGPTSNYYSKTLGGWNDASTNTFAIGSASGNSLSNGFVGSIANLTLISSGGISDLSNASIASYVGSMPEEAIPVPEPTTATLSLLALTGLAARRRRK